MCSLTGKQLEQSKDRHEEAIGHYQQAHSIATAK